MSKNSVVFEFSTKTYIYVTAIVLGFMFWAKILPIVIIIFVAFVFAAILLRPISFFIDKGWSKWLAILSVYLSAIVLVLLLGFLIASPISNQLSGFRDVYFVLIDNSRKIDEILFLHWGQVWVDFRDFVINSVGSMDNIVQAGFSTVGNVLKVASIIGAIITSFILSVYIVVDHDNLMDFILLQVTDSNRKKMLYRLIVDIEDKLSRWVVGQGLLSIIIGAAVWLLLFVTGVPLSLSLALFAALMESVPGAGPVLSAIPAVILAWISVSPLAAIIVVVGFVVIQQIENNFLVPKIMSNVVGLHPIIVFIGILIGVQIAGIMGAFLAVPILVLAKLGIEFYIDLKKLQAKGIV